MCVYTFLYVFNIYFGFWWWHGSDRSSDSVQLGGLKRDKMMTAAFVCACMRSVLTCQIVFTHPITTTINTFGMESDRTMPVRLEKYTHAWCLYHMTFSFALRKCLTWFVNRVSCIIQLTTIWNVTTSLSYFSLLIFLAEIGSPQYTGSNELVARYCSCLYLFTLHERTIYALRRGFSYVFSDLNLYYLFM